MLKIIIAGEESFDEENQMFVFLDEPVCLVLEHSLLSLSKWESEFEKPFLSADQKTPEETNAYIKAMILTPDYPEDIILKLTKKNQTEINDYIGSNYSATTFGKAQAVKRGRPEVITSELIYYWMVSYNVPFECEEWHLNRLFNLLQVCNIKNSKQKKMPKREAAAMQRDLNAKRKAELGTSG